MNGHAHDQSELYRPNTTSDVVAKLKERDLLTTGAGQQYDELHGRPEAIQVDTVRRYARHSPDLSYIVTVRGDEATEALSVRQNRETALQIGLDNDREVSVVQFREYDPANMGYSNIELRREGEVLFARVYTGVGEQILSDETLERVAIGAYNTARRIAADLLADETLNLAGRVDMDLTLKAEISHIHRVEVLRE